MQEKSGLPPKISQEIQKLVHERANFLCEYCHTDERWQLVRFTIDHIVPIAKGGDRDLSNLALACFHCNRRKSDIQAVFDQITQSDILLFNPRTMIWPEHFVWSDNKIIIEPRSDIGRITIDLLDLNRDRILDIRRADISVQRHPPADDTISNV